MANTDMNPLEKCVNDTWDKKTEQANAQPN